MRNIQEQYLNNTAANQQLINNGYIIIPFLNQSEIEHLTHTYKKYHTHTPEGLYATSHNENLHIRKEISSIIANTFTPHINNNFINCTALGGSYIVKTPGQKGILLPHQDWTLVDETKARSFNVWVPLVDTSPYNGGMYILEKSHTHFAKTYRGYNIPSIMDGLYDLAEQYMTPLYIKAGEALIYDHRLVHSSPINQSNNIRIAIAFGVIPNNTPMIYCVGNKNNIDIYQSNVDFFFNYNPEEASLKLNKIKTIYNPMPHVTKERFISLYQKNMFNKLALSPTFKFIILLGIIGFLFVCGSKIALTNRLARNKHSI